MKKILLLTIFVFNCGFLSANNLDENLENMSLEHKKQQLKIVVNDKIFLAHIVDNPSSQAFIKMLPLKIEMIELNGNEKYYNPPEHDQLPVQNSHAGIIKAGDLMVWDSSVRSVVLFYKNFTSPYKYVKIAQIDNYQELEQTLGAKNVVVNFALND